MTRHPVAWIGLAALVAVASCGPQRLASSVSASREAAIPGVRASPSRQASVAFHKMGLSEGVWAGPDSAPFRVTVECWLLGGPPTAVRVPVGCRSLAVSSAPVCLGRRLDCELVQLHVLGRKDPRDELRVDMWWRDRARSELVRRDWTLDGVSLYSNGYDARIRGALSAAAPIKGLPSVRPACARLPQPTLPGVLRLPTVPYDYVEYRWSSDGRPLGAVSWPRPPGPVGSRSPTVHQGVRAGAGRGRGSRE